MQTAAADTGMLLTRRGVARGFSVMTPRLQSGGLAPVDSAARAELPVVFYMAVGVAGQLAEEMIKDGTNPDTPCAFVFEAGSDREEVFRTTLNHCRAGMVEDLPVAAGRSMTVPLAITPAKLQKETRAGLFIVGEIARYGFDHTLGALGGQRVLLTCSEALMDQAVQAVHDFGGRPVVRPLIKLELNFETLETFEAYDWIALTSPSAVRCFQELLLLKKADFRKLPKIMSVGSGTARALEKIGLGCDLMPESDFSAQGLLEAAAPLVKGRKILRLRSQKAGPELADGLRAAGAEVDDVILYENRLIEYDRCPEFDAVFFASASAVDSFVSQWGGDGLLGRTVLAIGKPTQTALEAVGCKADVTGTMATVEKSLFELARSVVVNTIQYG
jgi:uroporphyrinogen-III synthase